MDRQLLMSGDYHFPCLDPQTHIAIGVPRWGRQRLHRTGSLKETSAHNQDGTRAPPPSFCLQASRSGLGQLTHTYPSSRTPYSPTSRPPGRPCPFSRTQAAILPERSSRDGAGSCSQDRQCKASPIERKELAFPSRSLGPGGAITIATTIASDGRGSVNGSISNH